MGSGAVDSSQWLSVKEETIFLHDGLIRVTDLAELPSEIGASEQGDTEQEVGESISGPRRACACGWCSITAGVPCVGVRVRVRVCSPKFGAGP